ncbi:MAG: hypothetical protein RQ847_09840 [Wenzhouxiangellaceae bacterium]|nr:hypothetical protein [Wenzhouxiangellaceae bacterium]
MTEFSRTSGIHGARPAPARRETVRRAGRAAAALVLLAVCGLAQAQPEPRVPCIDCPERVFSPRPETGLWNNPLDPTGTGFMLEVQGERVAGFHFGYDDAGEPVWFLIAGTLEMPADDSEALWVVESDLTRFSGGPCIDCPSSTPLVDGLAGTVRFEFLSRNHARFRVDGGAWQELISFAFGAAVGNPFAAVSDLPLPDLSGRWVVVLQSQSAQMPRSRVRGATQLVVLQRDDGAADAPAVRYRIFPVAGFCPPDSPCIGTPPPPPSIGVFECVGTQSFGPLCTLELESQAGMLMFTARPADISDSRWIAETGDGRDLQAFRVDHD